MLMYDVYDLMTCLFSFCVLVPSALSHVGLSVVSSLSLLCASAMVCGRKCVFGDGELLIQCVATAVSRCA